MNTGKRGRIVRDEYDKSRRLSGYVSIVFWRNRQGGCRLYLGWCSADPPAGLNPFQVDIGSNVRAFSV